MKILSVPCVWIQRSNVPAWQLSHFQDMLLCMLFTKWTLSSYMYIPFDNKASQLCITFTSQNGDRTSGSDESKSLKTWIILAVLWTKLAKGLLWEWAKYIISVTVFLAPPEVQDPQTFASESFVLSSCPWLALLLGSNLRLHCWASQWGSFLLWLSVFVVGEYLHLLSAVALLPGKEWRRASAAISLLGYMVDPSLETGDAD